MTSAYDKRVVKAYRAGRKIPMEGCPVCGKQHRMAGQCDQAALRDIDAANADAGGLERYAPDDGLMGGKRDLRAVAN